MGRAARPGARFALQGLLAPNDIEDAIKAREPAQAPAMARAAGRAGMSVRAPRPADRAERRRMRPALRPDATPSEHEAGMRARLVRADAAVVVSVRPGGGPAGFAEAGMRPCADGCRKALTGLPPRNQGG